MNTVQSIKEKIKNSELLMHETKRSVLIRYLIVLLIVIAYFVFISFKYGVKNGFLVTLLTWSVFVFCTPVADAGTLVDFPIRLLIHVRMIVSEIFVTLFAAALNIYALTFNPQLYDKTLLLRLFKHILLNPIPFWLIIILSTLGTFLSIYFGDELLDVAKHSEREKFKRHKSKYYTILLLFGFLLTVFLYDLLLKDLGIHL